jgi:hypothetical protein
MALTTFLNSTQRGGGGQWMNKWKDAGKVVVWLHTKVEPVLSYTHQFTSVEVGQEADSGRATSFTKWWKFVSPDPDPVHRNQHFRDDNDNMRVPPDRDPFLLLREWLRRADHIGMEDAIFRWVSPKDNEVTVWTRGELSGRIDRGKRKFGHTLDTKVEYIFAVVRNDSPNEGVLLARETQLVGQRVAEVIRQQQEELGVEGGDPTLHPYAFVWQFNKDEKSPMNKYKVWKGGHPCSDEIWAAITSDDPPDPSEYARFRDGDMQKMRAVMEAAARSAGAQLPFDEIFSEDPAVRLALVTGKRASRPANSSNGAQRPGASPPQQAAQRPANGASNGAQQPAEAAQRAAPTQRAAPPAAAQAAPAATSRRRKKEPEPEPPPPPQVEMIPCDDCGTPMMADATKCAKCGAEYDVDSDAPVTPVAATAGAKTCFLCTAPLPEGASHCPNCKVESDEIPF